MKFILTDLKRIFTEPAFYISVVLDLFLLFGGMLSVMGTCDSKMLYLSAQSLALPFVAPVLAAMPYAVMIMQEKETRYDTLMKIKLRAGGVSYWLSSSADEKSFPVTFSMPGRFNVENSLCAVAACCQSGLDIKTACDNLQQVKGVCGRAEVLYDGNFTVICDYAHTEDGLRKILSTVREFAKKRLIVVFGAAGERDAGKRKAMGECVGEYADIAVVTSDNPRFEDPQTIIDMVLEGFSDSFCQVESFIDRLEAIKFAVSEAADGDVIVLCGKGHEKYQVIGDDYQPFSEHDIIKELTDNIS